MDLKGYLHEYLNATANPVGLPLGTNEDQLKPPVKRLLESLGARVRTEVQNEVGRPDLGVWKGGLLVGFVELKAPDKTIEPGRFQRHDREQWERFRLLPNLVYTNGKDFALYRNGEEVKRATLEKSLGKGTPEPEETRDLEGLLLDFLGWQPIVPKDPKELAQFIAPITRYLREEVLAAMRLARGRGNPKDPLLRLMEDWKRTLIPEGDEETFADAFAQLVTYGFLLARLEWSEERGEFSLENVLAALETHHGLLMEALWIANHPAVLGEIRSSYDLLRRAIAAIDPKALQARGDAWLYFYEDFLEAYDPDLRKDMGAYYTPLEAVGAMARLVHDLLKRMGKEYGLASEGVTVLDPALGTGTFLLGVLTTALEEVERRYGPGFRGPKASEVASRLYGFERMIGPYAVAQLRLTRAVLDEGGHLPEGGLRVYLTDTLENPQGSTLHDLGMVYERLAEEGERAREVKNKVPILVCIGNPPYDREEADGERGGWVRRGDNNRTPLLQDFIEPLSDRDRRYLPNLYNLYVYFWRWALWKVFEHDPERPDTRDWNRPGIVAFITASSYLQGPGFKGMREYMRKVLDELWIVDLGGEGRGAVKEENIFNIQTPVAIAIAVRYGPKDKNTPARVFYTRIKGDRQAKLNRLDQVSTLRDLEWQEAPTGWQDPFTPEPQGEYATWPKITDLFPWQHSGVKAERTWPISPKRDVLERRWGELVSAPVEQRASLFKENRDRKIDETYPSLFPPLRHLPAIAQLTLQDRPERYERYAYRSFDRAWIIADGRVLGYPRKELWHTWSPKQVYLTSLLTEPLGRGPALIATPYVPDLHHFSGRGAKDIIPLYRDKKGKEPNLTRGLLEFLEGTYGFPVGAEDFLAYVYALLAHPGYTARFAAEVQTPPPRVPITKDGWLFRLAVRLGKRLLCLHTYGERFGNRCRLNGQARWRKQPSRYPQDFRYDEKAQTLYVGNGEVYPVSPEVWAYEVSGFHPLRRWLDYRKASRGGRKSSPLDEIGPTVWDADLSRELLELIWVLEGSLRVHRCQERLLQRILEGPLFQGELPQPKDEERNPPLLGEPEEEERSGVARIL